MERHVMGWRRIAAGMLLGGLLPSSARAEVVHLGTNLVAVNRPEVTLRTLGIHDDQIGRRTIGLGDVNGDGHDDVMVGRNSNSHYVIFGSTVQQTFTLTTLDSGTSAAGFLIVAEPDGFSLDCIGAAGDVNGDGLADMLLGRRTGPNPAVGRVYVVFGKTTLGNVQLFAIAAGGSTAGFVINGAQSSQAGGDVGGLGDLNGDGLADIVIAAPGTGPAATPHPGRAFVVFGRTATSNVALSDIVAGSTLGFYINGPALGEVAAHKAKGAGDFNGDGIPDVVLGNYSADPPVGSNAGRAFIVFGKTTTTPVELSSILDGSSTAGWAFNPTAAGEFCGGSVAGVGDTNGDGVADVAIGAFGANSSAGRAYVVFGHSGSGVFELSSLAAGSSLHGFVAEGPSGGRVGVSLGAGGDYDGDGLADVLIGAPTATGGGFSGAGRAYLLLGRTANSAVPLTMLHDGLSPLGTPMEALVLNDDAGRSLASAGDFNADAAPDAIIGVPLHDIFASGAINGGAAFVLTRPGRTLPTETTYRSWFRSGAAPMAGVGALGDGHGTVLWADSRFYVQFVGGTGPSPADVTLHRSRDVIYGLNASKIADVAWFATSPRFNYRQANVVLRYTAAEIAGLNTANLRVFTATSPAGPWSPIVPAAVFDLANRRASLSVATFDRWYAIGEFDAALIQNGDANADGRRDVADVTAIHNFVEGLVGTLAGDGDVDNLNGVEAVDAVLVADHIVNGTPLP